MLAQGHLADGLLRQGVGVRFAFIDEHRRQWPVRVMCKVLEVSPSGYYAWRKRPQSATAKRRGRLTVIIKAIHKESRQNYGSPRVFKELQARGEPCNVKTVARIMRENDIMAKRRRKFKVTTDSNHRLPVAENLLDRQFTVAAPNRAWVCDITYILTWEGWLYLATVQDLFSRKIVGWSMQQRMTRQLVIDALEMAVDRLGFSARAYTRVLKVARTIADLSGEIDILPMHISEAIQYRQMDKYF